MNTQQSNTQTQTQHVNGVAKSSPSPDSPEYKELLAMLQEARAQNAKLLAKQSQHVAQGLTMRVSEKGAVSVYGLGQFPVTLYGEQWQRLLAVAEDVKTFIECNKDKLAVKPAKPKGEGTRVDMASGQKAQ
jgi:hypothetical protein